MTDLLLRYNHNVVEHLGLKLYQNRPTRVIAEVVSNSWDADATAVSVNLEMTGGNRWVAVLDNGHGMTRDVLANAFLVIGRPRRAQPGERSPKQRPLMGRKGIGKLAPFGIARKVQVITAAVVDDEPVVHWLAFDLEKLLAQGEDVGEYEPDLIYDGGDLQNLPVDQDSTGQVQAWLNHIQSDSGPTTGTIVIMSSLTLGRAIGSEQLLESLGSRFTVTLADEFSVEVNGKLVTPSNALPDFELRIPERGFDTTVVGGREVRYWVGFVKSASWPQDSAGVGVYAHGKIGQDRPFTFGVKGKEIFTRYMYGVVEADWLDELEADLISTDRTSINWDTDETADLLEWGQRQVRSWVSDFELWRRQKEGEENRVRVMAAVAAGMAPKVTETEEDEIVHLVSSITPSFGKDEESKNRLVKAVSEAWVQKPMRRLVKDLWSSVGQGAEMPPATFTTIIERLSSHSIPESLNLAVVFAQRAFALTRLHDYVHHGSEVNLQRLVEKFPWIVEPDLAVLTANQELKTAVDKAEQLGQIPTGRRTIVGGTPDRNRPDFVFLSSPENRQIVVVELKNPQEDLTIDNRRQLEDYMSWFEAHYGDAEIRGYLVGRNSADLKPKYAGMAVIRWTEVLRRSRARNLELLAAMLLRTGLQAGGDIRVADAIELGGEDARRLLERLAKQHGELSSLMDSFKDVDIPSSSLSTLTDD